MIEGIKTIDWNEFMGNEANDGAVRHIVSARTGKVFEWDKWSALIPEIQFPADWKIRIVPPRTGAMIRFRVTTSKAKDLSVYLDCYDLLAMWGGPYWEVYPASDGDVARFDMEDVEGLLEEIGKCES